MTIKAFVYRPDCHCVPCSQHRMKLLKVAERFIDPSRWDAYTRAKDQA